MLDPVPVYDDEELIDYDTFCAIIPDGQKADLIDGVIYVASPDSERANTLTNFINMLLYWYNVRRQLGGRVYVNRFAFRLSNRRAPEPDVAYVRRERLHLIEDGGMLGGPDIAVEVVAHESRDRDYTLKRAMYEQAGVEEYWIVDYLQRRLEFLQLNDGVYQRAELENNRLYRSRVLPGFWIDSDWLLARPLPDAAHCIDAVLASNA